MSFFENKNKLGFATAFAFILLCNLFAFKDYVQKPEALFPAAGDGMKNYFTFLYHIEYDSTYMTFEGMNYPFGENVVFTDNQPILSNSLKFLTHIFPSLGNHMIGIHNGFLILVLSLCSLGFFLCLRFLKVNYFFALACTAAIMLLQPQLARINGHYGLFYPILPMLFYLWFRMWDEQKYVKHSIIYGALVTALGLAHMYHFVLAAFLCILAIGVTFASEGEIGKNSKKYAVIFLLQIILPFFILYSATAFFSMVADRPTNPWGFFVYNATWEGLFFSYKLPLFEFINAHVVKVRLTDFEGRSYIGMISILICLLGLLKLVFAFRKQMPLIFPSYGLRAKLLWIFVFSSLISFGLPFIIPGLEDLLDYTGPFKQFRTIGRVAWIAFYAINFLAISYVSDVLKSQNNRRQEIICQCIIVLIICYEGLMKFPSMENPDHIKDSFVQSKPKLPIDRNEYQAILPDPYYHVGSECFGWGDLGGNIDQAYALGYQLGLPSMGVSMSRTSLKQSLLLNELVNKPYKVPDIISMLKAKDQRPLLVLETKNSLINYNSSLSHWTKEAKIVYECDDYRLKSLDLSAFDTISRKFNDSIANVVDNRKIQPLTLTHTQKKKNWGYETVLQVDSTLRGQKTLSFWVECNMSKDVRSITEIWQIDENHNNIEYRGEGNQFNYKRYDGNKLLIEIQFDVKRETKKLAIRISKDGQKQQDVLKIEKPCLKG